MDDYHDYHDYRDYHDHDNECLVMRLLQIL